jgi:hypothetical protein
MRRDLAIFIATVFDRAARRELLFLGAMGKGTLRTNKRGSGRNRCLFEFYA